MARRRIDPVEGRATVQAWRNAENPAELSRTVRGTAVRFSLEELAALSPGRSVEVRVPPFGVTQCIQGPDHTRGTPPNVIETDPYTWMALCLGTLTWDDARASGAVAASGLRADLSERLPLF